MGHNWTVKHAYIQLSPFDGEYELETLSEEDKKKFEDFKRALEEMCEDTFWEVNETDCDNICIKCEDARGYKLSHITDLEEIVKKINAAKFIILPSSYDYNPNKAGEALCRFTSIPEDNDYLYSTRVTEKTEGGGYVVETYEINFVKQTFEKFTE